MSWSRVQQIHAQEETEEEKQKTCEYLNSVRANYTICCHYPLLVMWTYQYNECLAECNVTGWDTHGSCCLQPCCLRKIGLLNPVYNEDGVLSKSEVDWLGLVYSFMLSVGNDTQWFPVVNGTSYRCYLSYSETQNGVDCGGIPLNLYDVIGCCYNENFLKCPPWNPHNIKQCDQTWQYVKKCFA